jgi:PrgI family protein
MKFRVPQFIDVEDKLFGPLTFRQFLYLLGAAALAFVIWSLIPFKFIAVMLAGPVLGFGVALAFVRINNRPFMNILEAGFIYFTKSKLYRF